MIRLSVALVLSLAALVLPSAAAADPAPLPGEQALSITEYRGELQRLLALARRLDGTAQSVEPLVATTPPAWHVVDGKRQFVVRADGVRSDLQQLQGKPDGDARQRVQAKLQRLLDDADGYDTTPPDRTKERARLSGILARREFSAMHGPTWWDRLKQRAREFVVNVLARIFGSSRFPVIASAIVYALVALAVLVTAFWIYRTLRGGAVATVVPDTLAVSAKPWVVWLAEAREAAAGGRWRDAVHLAYWAGISCLESRSVWPPDRARTPREYLRLLPVASEHRPALSALTRTFEPVWYGRQPADAATFADAVSQLERLGAVRHDPVTPATAPHLEQPWHSN